MDPGSPVPPFEQLRAQLATAIRGGLLPDGSQLPPIRQLAGDLSLAPNTVARAYRELEEAGLVQGRGRRGTVVTGPASPGTRTQLEDAARTYLAEAQRFNLNIDDAVAVLRMIS